MKAPKAKEHFRNLLSDPEDSIRAASAEALGLLGERTVGPDLLPALGDSSPAVRAAAVESLGKLEAKEYAHEILLRLDDPDDSVKAAAAEALGRLRDADALPPLARLIGYPNPLVREKAVQALGSFSGPLAVDSLLGALSDKNDRVRWYAVASLGKIGDPKSRAELIKTLSDEKAALREAAAEALAKVGDESTLPLLESTMSDADSRVAEKAKWAFLELASSNSQLLRREAERLLEKKAYDLARVLYERLLEKYSTSEPELKPDALWKLARIDFEAGKEQEAAERFEDLVNSYPARLDIKREYAHLLSLMGRLGRSASLYTQLAKDEPEWRAEYLEQTFEAVEALFNSGDFSEVLRAIEEVEKAAPDFGGEVLAGKFSELRKKASASSKENESGQEKASPLKDTEVPRSNSSPEAASKIPPPSDSSSRKD